MSNRSKRTPVVEGNAGYFQEFSDKWSKGLHRRAKWDKESFDDFPVCVHWFRQIASLIVGIALGVIGITGAPGLVGGYGLVTGLTYVYYAVYIEVDEFSFGEGGLKMEGLIPSLALYILVWTTCYTAMGHGLTDSAE